jgi:hypothetical protein
VRIGRSWSPALLLLVGIVLAGAGLAMTAVAPRADSADIGPPAAITASPVAGAAATAHPPGAAGSVTPPVVAAPVALSLPDATDLPVVPVGVLPSGALQLPDRPTVLGWFAAGAAPGAQAGTAVIAGHLDLAVFGPGPLVRLSNLRVGDVLQLTDAAGVSHRFSVVSRRSYPKPALPPEVFRRDGPPRLAVVTCGGAFDAARRSYADNVVVLAVPA